MAVKPSSRSPSPRATPMPPRATVRRAIPASGSMPASPRNPLATRSPLPQLRSFLVFLAPERGLAKTPLPPYRRDLEDLDDFFRAASLSFITAGPDEFRAYL